MGVVVITGGSRGIGAATAKLLAQQGWDIRVSYRVERTAAEEVVDACRNAGRQCSRLELDVSSEADGVDVFTKSDETAHSVRW